MAASNKHLERMYREDKYVKVLLVLGLENLTTKISEDVRKELLETNLGPIPFFIEDAT